MVHGVGGLTEGVLVGDQDDLHAGRATRSFRKAMSRGRYSAETWAKVSSRNSTVSWRWRESSRMTRRSRKPTVGGEATASGVHDVGVDGGAVVQGGADDEVDDRGLARTPGTRWNEVVLEDRLQSLGDEGFDCALGLVLALLADGGEHVGGFVVQVDDLVRARAISASRARPLGPGR